MTGIKREEGFMERLKEHELKERPRINEVFRCSVNELLVQLKIFKQLKGIKHVEDVAAIIPLRRLALMKNFDLL